MMHQEMGDSLLIAPSRGINDVDEHGYTPLHHAVIRNNPNLIEQLLQLQGANINATNNTGCTSLHIAVLYCLPKCVEVLLHYHCDVNLQDFMGDTALHNALKSPNGNDNDVIINLLCDCERVDFTLRNSQGYNVLHLATFLGKAHAVNRLVTRAPHLVDMKTTSEFTALHIAAAEGHQKIAAILLSQHVRATIDLCSGNKETPLHLATLHQNWSLVELLVCHNADISKVNRYGDTALHNAIGSGLRESITPERCKDSPFIHAIWQNLARQGARTELALACFLVSVDKSGKLLEHARNNLNQTPLDLMKFLIDCTEFQLNADLLRSYSYHSQLGIKNSLDLMNYLRTREITGCNLHPHTKHSKLDFERIRQPIVKDVETS